MSTSWLATSYSTSPPWVYQGKTQCNNIKHKLQKRQSQRTKVKQVNYVLVLKKKKIKKRKKRKEITFHSNWLNMWLHHRLFRRKRGKHKCKSDSLFTTQTILRLKMIGGRWVDRESKILEKQNFRQQAKYATIFSLAPGMKVRALIVCVVSRRRKQL